MSARQRKETRDKIDGIIDTLVEQEKTKEEKEWVRDVATSAADIVFGIWKALDQIPAAINDAVRKDG